MYYTIINRDEFVSLYQFGNIRINYNYILANNENIETRLIELLKILPFELDYEEKYLILKINDIFTKDKTFETIQSIFTLNIEDIKSLYTLSTQAQQLYKVKFNHKINFQISPFDNILKQVNDFKEYQDINQGIKILTKQFDFMNIEKIETELGKHFIDNFLSLENHLSELPKNFYFDLLSYPTNKVKFPTDVGYIYHLIIITLLQTRKEGLKENYDYDKLKEKLKSTGTYIKLDNAKKETLFENIELLINSDDKDIKKFILAITDKHLVVGAIFLKIKYLLKEDNRDKNTQQKILKVVDTFGSKYKDELSIALYLIGLVYGYKNLYDDYYDFLKLDIFKDSENDTIDEVVQKKEEIDLRDEKVKTLEEENEKLKLELEKMKGKSNKETFQKVKEEPSDVSSEDNTKIANDVKVENKLVDKHEINTFTDEEILVFSRSHLEKIAKKRGVEKPTSKKTYPKGDEGQIKLYKAMLKMTSLI